MTWLKLSDDFADECARVNLSDAAFRLHVEGLGWVMRRETGGSITQTDLRRFAETVDVRGAVQELCDVGFWTATSRGFVLNHHMQHQPEPDLLAARRTATAERVRKHRRTRAGLKDDAGNAVTPPATERVTRDGSGRDGTGNPTPLVGNQQDPDPWSISDVVAQ
jgi:hypothetical protein